MRKMKFNGQSTILQLDLPIPYPMMSGLKAGYAILIAYDRISQLGSEIAVRGGDEDSP